MSENHYSKVKTLSIYAFNTGQTFNEIFPTRTSTKGPAMPSELSHMSYF